MLPIDEQRRIGAFYDGRPLVAPVWDPAYSKPHSWTGASYHDVHDTKRKEADTPDTVLPQTNTPAVDLSDFRQRSEVPVQNLARGFSSSQ